MLRPWTLVGFTGNRTLEKPELVSAKIAEALKRIADHTGSPLAAISSAAKGADTLFAEAVAQREMPWILLLPFAREKFFNEHDFSAADLARIEPLAARALRVHIEPEPTGPGSEEQLRTESFQTCSARTVDECDYLIAVWNGEAGRAGGTRETMDYARQQGRPLVVIHALTGEITEENFPPRAAAPAAVTPPPLDPVHGGLPALQSTLAHYDQEAMSHAPVARDLVTLVIFLHLGATAIGLFAPIFGILSWIAIFPAAIKVCALLYAGQLAHNQHHAKGHWLRYRLIAEVCRSAVGTWHLAYSDRTHLPVRIPGLQDWQRTLRLWRLAAPPATLSVAEQRDAYLRERLDSPQTGQIPYFQKHYNRAKARYDTWHGRAVWSTRIAIALGIVVLVKSVIGFYASNPGSHIVWADALKYLSLVLPLSSAAIFTWLSSSDCRRRVERNAEMLSYLQAARARIARATTATGLERQVAETETVLLLEILEWHSIAHFTADAH